MRRIALICLASGCASDFPALDSALATMIGKPKETAVSVLGAPYSANETGDGAVYRWRDRRMVGVQTGTGTAKLPLDCEIEIDVDADGAIRAARVEGDYGACEGFEGPLQRYRNAQ